MPRGRVIRFRQDKSRLYKRVADFLGTGLAAREGAVASATPQHQ
jgi:hypothetical protein